MVNRIRNTTTKAIPNQGRKNGKKAMELSRRAKVQLMGVKSNISSITTDNIKCSNTMKKVAWMKLVMEVISYCLCWEKIDLNTPWEEW